MIDRDTYAEITALAATYGECGERVYVAMWNEAMAREQEDAAPYISLLKLRMAGSHV